MASRSRRPLAWVAALAAVVAACDCGEPEPEGPARPEPSPPAGEEGRGAGPALSFVDPPAAEGAFAPSLRVDGDGVWATWIEPIGADGHRVRVSRLAGGRWSDPVTMASSEAMFANWADFPSVVRAGDGSLIAHWLEKSADETYAYDIVLLRSTDGGTEWSRLGSPHDDGTPTEHGFVSYSPTAEGVRMFWLDGRHTQPDDDGERGPTTLRTAELVGDVLGPSALVDPRVCDCCRTAAAPTDRGAMVVYRDRSAGEIRDTAMVRVTPDGWSDPAPVHADGWELRGCPVNGPALSTEAGRAAVAWFTGEGERAGVWLAFGDSAEGALGDPVRVAGPGTLGRVGVALDRNGEGAAVSWVDVQGDGASVLRLAHVTSDGVEGEPATLASLPPDRGSGFPQLVRLDDRLLLAWVEGEAELSRLRAATTALR